MVVSGSGLKQESMAGFMVLVQLLSMLMSLAPDITRSVQSWPCPSLAAPLRRTVCVPHGLSTLERGSYTSPGQHNRADPVDRVHEDGMAGTAAVLCGVVVGVRERRLPPCPYRLQQMRELELPHHHKGSDSSLLRLWPRLCFIGV